MIYCIKTDTRGIFRTYSRPERQSYWDNIAPGLQARWCLRRAFRCPLLRAAKRVGKFAADAGAWREALDMYPRERRKPTDAVKSQARFERNA